MSNIYWTKFSKKLIISTSDDNSFTILTDECLIGNDRCMCGTMSFSFQSCVQITGSEMWEKRELKQSKEEMVSPSIDQFERNTTWVSSSEHSIFIPFPLFSRWYRAAAIAPTLDKPVARSMTATPTLTGSYLFGISQLLMMKKSLDPTELPVMLIIPPIPWTIKS